MLLAHYPEVDVYDHFSFVLSFVLLFLKPVPGPMEKARLGV